MIGRWLSAYYYLGEEQMEYSGRVSKFKLERGVHWAFVELEPGGAEWVDLSAVEWRWLEPADAERRALSIAVVQTVEAICTAAAGAGSGGAMTTWGGVAVAAPISAAPTSLGLGGAGDRGASRAGSGPQRPARLDPSVLARLQALREWVCGPSAIAVQYACVVSGALPLLLELACAREEEEEEEEDGGGAGTHGRPPQRERGGSCAARASELALCTLNALLLQPGARYAVLSETRALARLVARMGVLLGAGREAEPARAVRACTAEPVRVGRVCGMLVALQHLALEPGASEVLLGAELSLLDTVCRALSLLHGRPRVCALNLLHNLALGGGAAACHQITAGVQGRLVAQVLHHLEPGLTVGPAEGGLTVGQAEGRLAVVSAEGGGVGGGGGDGGYALQVAESGRAGGGSNIAPPSAEAAPELSASTLDLRRRAAALVLALSAGAAACLVLVENGLLRHVSNLVASSEDDPFLRQVCAAVHGRVRRLTCPATA
jgi:hypothetical protein